MASTTRVGTTGTRISNWSGSMSITTRRAAGVLCPGRS
uniref:Tubulin beta chain n=1 Tax=Rhizophora mucronata TaxID=61149 RepID=A0A2P2L228_RHIMU